MNRNVFRYLFVVAMMFSALTANQAEAAPRRRGLIGPIIDLVKSIGKGGKKTEIPAPNVIENRERIHPSYTQCPFCKGSGKIRVFFGDSSCSNCGGTGKLKTYSSFR